MSDIHPDLAAFRAAKDDAARARVLVTAAYAPLLLYRRAFLVACNAAGFTTGAEFLHALSAWFKARRHRGVPGDGRDPSMGALQMELNRIADTGNDGVAEAFAEVGKVLKESLAEDGA